MKELGMTEDGVEILQKVLKLEPPEQRWVLEAWVRGLDSEMRRELLTEFVAIDSNQAEAPTNSRPSFEMAKERLLDDPGLPGAEKALLAALVLRDLYEIEKFSSRQITETLKETGNQLSNVTTALNSLIQKGFVRVIASETSTSRNAQKTYQLSDRGVKRANSLAESDARQRT